MLWPDAALEQALTRVPNAPPPCRLGQDEETLIGREFSYSSARLGGIDARSNTFPTNFLWLPLRVNRVVKVLQEDARAARVSGRLSCPSVR